MLVTITATEQPLSKIFCNDFAFSIPDYQRPYSWMTEQAAELLGDLETAMGDGKTPLADLNPYFLGNIVLIKGHSPEAEVVDGQQRLTTLTLLLAVLRSLVQKSVAESVTKYLYEQGDVIEDTPNRYRLNLRPRDEIFFRDHVQEEDGVAKLLALPELPIKDVERNIATNARYFHEQLENWASEKRELLLRFLVTRCFLVVVETPDLDSAYRIFSVLNARGLNLGLTDLLKASVIGAIPESERPKYTQIWEEEEEALGREGFNDLFTQIRMIRRKTKARQTILSEYEQEIKPQLAPKNFIDGTLKPCSDALLDILNCSYRSSSRADEINEWFRWLGQLDNIDWQAPAILYLSQHRSNPKALAEFFKDLERLAASLLVCRADINQRLERYGKLLGAIENGDDLTAPNSPLQLTAREKKDTLEYLDGYLYRVVRIRQYVLLRLDFALSGATHNYPMATVEHVLPQNPKAGSQWLAWWPDDDKREDWVHCLGNLLLLTKRKNSSASNLDFAEKKTKYFASANGISPYALTTDVFNYNEWTPAIVEARHKKLLSELKKLWRL